MKNPIDAFIDEHIDSPEVSNYTNLAKTAGVSVQVVTKTVKGVYPHISPKVLRILREYDNVTPWVPLYEDWIDRQVFELSLEIEHGNYPALALFTPSWELSIVYESYARWRFSLNESLMGFCGEWKLPHATMIGWESGKGIDLPLVLRDRLRVLLPVTGKNEAEVERYIRALKNLPRR